MGRGPRNPCNPVANGCRPAAASVGESLSWFTKTAPAVAPVLAVKPFAKWINAWMRTD
jgi:hypothetical protein